MLNQPTWRRLDAIWMRVLVVILILLAAAFLGHRASAQYAGLIVAGFGALALLYQPRLGLLAIIGAALIAPLEFGTGTEVRLNTATLLVPALLVVWILAIAVRRRVRFTPSSANPPLLLFLGASLLSLLIGIATWDPVVPRSSNFILVQLAQWAIFVFSAGAFWLTANLATEGKWLRRMTWSFLLIGGAAAIGRQLPGLSSLTNQVTTIAFIRPPFWVLLAGLAGGQLLFNRSLRGITKWGLAAVVLSAFFYAFVEQQEAASNWVGIGVVAAVLLWLRFPRLRWPMLVFVVALAVTGILFPSVYEFAGGEEEWTLSGQSRIVLGGRVIEVTMRNPVTGLGPAGYRPYANMKPLRYGGAYWLQPQINSHNNYVDLFAQGGILGLALFAWFAVTVGRLGERLRMRYPVGFTGGYVNGLLACGTASLVLMMFADWILPFVYNIGFPGFQASVLVWLFMGGLVALDNAGTVEGSRFKVEG